MRAIDLFAGCGGLSLGFQKAGIDIVGAFENWQPAIAIYQANFNHPVFETDLSQVSDYSIFSNLKPDMIIGGPPCQDFSSAGKRNEDNGRGDLTVNYAEIVNRVRPEWFVMENVERILKTQKLKQAKKIFVEAGYGLSEIVLDASYCEVPQARKRYILIGKLGETNHFMDYYLTKNQTKKPMSIFDYLGKSLGTEYYYRHPRSYARRGVFSIYEPSPTIRGVNRPIPKGYKKHEGDPVDDFSKVRPLTTKERTYIQTFPKEFEWLGNKTELEQIIGNAVPVNLAKFVGNCIKEYINDTNKRQNIKRHIGALEFEYA
ncbi:MAG: DNA cytosine methyltransferase [Dysgonamonadaceae bacterium]|jgi:DNA (cytosine-5)-methyltransferase 1|nr:DNA cytosine methyltransferase [Dysgonamonadaceae bacterium]